MLHLVDVTKHFGKRTLFTRATLHVSEGDRVGLVGPNGSGKTTIFRLVHGDEPPDEGEIAKRKLLRIGYLPQEIETRREGPVLRTVVDGVRDIGALRREHDALVAALRDPPADEDDAKGLARRLSEVEELFAHAGGYEVEAEAREVLAGLGFSVEDMARPLRTFSGGWQVRAELARLLLDRPDLLLLDEPTNHLDLESIQWFERYLAGFGGAFLLVSHDREFLNRVVTRIAEVRPDGIRSYPGNYDTYRRMRVEDEVLQEKRYKEQQARIREIQDFIDRNRVRKDRAAQVQSRLKMLEGMERLTPPVSEGSIHFRFPSPQRSGDVVMRLEGMTKRYGSKTVFDGLDLTLFRGDRIAIVGLNGAGKSTLLKIIGGRLALEAGTRALGSNVTIDYFAQHQLEALTPENTVLQEISGIADVATGPMLRGILGAFQFSGEDVDKRVAILSGGEKSRLALAKMLLRPANLLLMDEPTNHLDIASREVLERALSQYDGTLCLTSHDRRFIDAVATKVLEVDAGRLTFYPGTYSDYAWKRAREDERDAAAAAPPTQPSAPRARDLDKQRKRQEAEQREKIGRALKPLREELAKLEGAIELGERKIGALAAKLADPELYKDAEKARQTVLDHETLQKKVQRFYGRWEELHTELEAAEAALAKETP